MRSVKLNGIIICLFFGLNSFAQNILKLSDAQTLVLENNFGLKIAEKNIELARNQVYKANAGMSPIIDWNTSFGTLFNQVNQRFVDGRVINRLGRSLSPISNLAMTYTLYDGRRMQAVFQRLETQSQLSAVQKQIQIQNTLSNVMQIYYNIQRLQSTENYLNEIIKYYEERQKLTEERWQIGRGSKLDFIQSKTDLSIQKTNITNVQQQLRNTKVELNGVLARNPTTDFTVENDEKLGGMYALQDLIEQSKTKNPEIQSIRKTEEINLIQQKEASSFKKPRINLNSSFGYNFNSNNAGLITYNQSIGLNTAITAQWRIFDGQTINRNIQATKINADIIQLQKADLQNRIENDLTSAFYQYESDKKIVEQEKENRALAAENLDISTEKFKLGASTILEINDAQTRYNTVLNRLVNAQYNVKISELNLLTISGGLLR
jgi:outer membrane protein